MSWLFSQALVAEYLGDTFLDGEPSVPLSGNNTQLAYLQPDKMTDFSRLSRFGMMFKPLTETLGKELLMLYRAGFHAKTLVQQERGGGIESKRSGMWKEMARIIGEVRPQYAFVENSPMLTTRGLGTVLSDLSQMGFNAEWCVLGADSIGAHHRRERVWVLAYSNCIRPIQRKQNRNHLQKQTIYSDKPNNRNGVWSEADGFLSIDEWKKFTSNLCRVDDELAARVDRLKAIGNGQVPLCAATAWNILKGRLDERYRPQ
jgi:DNA (cytosine-5)-methyltransferase 1